MKQKQCTTQPTHRGLIAAGVASVVSLLGAGVHAQPLQYNKLYTMQTLPAISQAGATDSAWYFDSLQTGSAHARLLDLVREGGWSDLAMDPSDPTGQTFWSINDRGLNVAYEPEGGVYKIFAYPNYHQKIARFQIDGDSLRVLHIDSIKGLGGAAYVTGLPSTKAPTGETALTMNRLTAEPDLSATNAASPNGYDFEGIVLRDGKFYLADEYGPFIIEMDSATMTMTKEWYPANGLPNVLARRRANRGMEGLAITPSGKLMGIVQSPMLNPASPTTRDSRVLRLVWLNPATDEVKEFAYIASNKGGARRGRDVKIGAMTAIDESRFLVLEHGSGTFEGQKKYWIDIFLIDITGATNVTLGAAGGADPDSSGRKWGGQTLEQLGMNVKDLLDSGVVPVRKNLLLGDLMGTTPWPHEKPEGLVLVNDTTLAINNDNDYGMTDNDADGIPHILPANQRVSQIMYIKVPNLRPAVPQGARLSVMHNNDGESKLLQGKDTLGTIWGGAARFKATVDSLRALDNGAGRQVLMLSSGDNFLAGKEWSASLALAAGRSYYDAVLMDRVDYDAICIGNHDFDFGPEVLARFINSFTEHNTPFLSANLDYSAEDTLQALVDAGRIAKSVVVSKGGHDFGIIGATTPMLGYISSPGRVAVGQQVATAVQTEINELHKMGINKIILISHLQSVREDLALAAMLEGVDIMVAGGGDDLLGNPGNTLFPGDAAFAGPYPTNALDASGSRVPIITTAGEYKYVGRMLADFDAWGVLDSVLTASGPVAVRGSAETYIMENVEDSVRAYVAGLTTQIIGTSEVGLNGMRDSVRSVETNLGNLMADAMLWKARSLALTAGVDSAVVAIQNGGGIRNNNIIAAGSITVAHTFDIAPFANYLTVVQDVPVGQFKELLENAVSRVEFKDGRFAQIAGFTLVYDTSKPAQVLDTAYAVVTPGERVRQVHLRSGILLIDSGRVVDSSLTVDIATIDFLSRGGDLYPYRGLPINNLGVSYQATIQDYIQTGLAGTIAEDRYPAGGEGRITKYAPNGPTPTKSAVLPRAIGFAAWLEQGKIAVRAHLKSATVLEARAIDGTLLAHVSLQAGPNELWVELPSAYQGVVVLRLGTETGMQAQLLHSVRVQ